MTRIGAGNGIPNQSSIDNPNGVGVGTALRADQLVCSAATQRRDLAIEGGPDRPAPRSGGGASHTGTDVRVFFADLNRWEGKHSFMYVDTRGHVTTGVGHLLKDAKAAAALPWCHKSTGRPATPAEVKVAFDHLSQIWANHKLEHPNGKGMTAAHFEKQTDLVLPEGHAAKLAMNRLRDEFLPKLRHLLPKFDSYPLPAQRALVDMAYNLGVGKLGKSFPTLIRACRNENFALAAVESERSSSRRERNDATRDLFLEAARLNGTIQALNREVRL